MSEQSIEFAPGVLKKAAEHGLLTYPEEACGLVFGPAESNGVTAFVACQNIQNGLHRLDAQRYPRTAQNAYQIAPEEIKKWEEHFAGNLRLRGIVHSHNDVGIYFSDEDRAMAAPWGEPLFPQIFYLVLGVNRREGGPDCAGAGLYVWNEEKKSFEEKILDVKVF